MTGTEEETCSDPVPVAPVLLFVFNRPQYTQRVLEAIRRARPANLLVVADGPRPNRLGESENCRQTRDLVLQAVEWAGHVECNFAPENMGCKARISSGLQWGFSRFEELILLEDDCVPIPSFFRYCTELLSHYRHDQRIGMIAGTNYRGVPQSGSRNSYFASRHANIWGWASWRRAYSGYDPDVVTWRRRYHPRDLKDWFADWRSAFLHSTMFDVARETEIDTWDVGWSYHLACRRMLSLVPDVNLVSNIGVAGSRGREQDANNFMPTADLSFPLIHPDHIEPDVCYDRLVASRHRLFFDWVRGKWSNRVRRWLRLNT